MSVQALGPEFAVERLDVGIVSGLSWPREVQCDTPLLGPEVHIARHKLASVVEPDRPWVARLTANPI